MRGMQRTLVIAAVIVLVVACLAMGTLAAHWPFWQRAWQWYSADNGWPVSIKGAVQVLHADPAAPALDIHIDPQLADIATSASTLALLRTDIDGRVDAWFAPGVDATTLIDGRGLTPLVLPPVFAQLLSVNAALLDTPVGAWFEEWSGDRRGPITPRQLFQQLSGMPAGAGSSLNPFTGRARLQSGPDFGRAALHWQPTWPPGSHFEESPANAQLLALVASRIDNAPFAEVVQRRLWSRMAANDATAMLDHRGGDMAAHCCLRASIGDWLRLGALLAHDGRHGTESLWQRGFLAQVSASSPVHASQGLGFQLISEGEQTLLAAGSDGRRLLVSPTTSTAVLWIGDGAPPPGLARLLP
jgi:CubicO group peptidase (beta-lactamase class C family)